MQLSGINWDIIVERQEHRCEGMAYGQRAQDSCHT